jgi:hypothetical protein
MLLFVQAIIIASKDQKMRKEHTAGKKETHKFNNSLEM